MSTCWCALRQVRIALTLAALEASDHTRTLIALAQVDTARNCSVLQNANEEVSAIFIEPPEDNIYSHECSADNDSGVFVDLCLSGKQLRACAETVLADGHRIGANDTDNSEAEGDK